jgi:integrating conjugative element membrane protein (TIGR03747 family)
LAWFCLIVSFLGEGLLFGLAFAQQKALGIVTMNIHFIEQNTSVLSQKIIRIFYIVHKFLGELFNNTGILKFTFIQNTIQLLLFSLEIDISRILIFCLALPLFVLILLVGVTDGLVQRDIRKFQSAGESSFKFHHIKGLFGFLFFIPFFIYLALPLAVNPYIFLPVQALLLGATALLSVKYFKKYL